MDPLIIFTMRIRKVRKLITQDVCLCLGAKKHMGNEREEEK